MFAIGEIGVAEAFYVELERGLHVEVCDFERGVMHLAFAKRPGAWRFVLIDIDVEYLRCTAIAECVALVIAVAALRLQVPSIAHERVHLLIARSEEHTSELQSLMRISYAVFCLKKKKTS